MPRATRCRNRRAGRRARGAARATRWNAEWLRTAPARGEAMTRLVPRLALGLTLASSPAFAVSAAKIQTLGGPLDGTAVGDVNADGRLETALLARTGRTSSSSISLRDGAGNVIWNKLSTVELAGAPLMADFDGDGQDEIAYCELAEQGYCRILGAQGQQKAQVGPFYFPGMTTSGPAAADVTGDGIAELIVASFGGLVGAYRGNGQKVWSTDLWQLHGEQIFGHPALGDLDGNGTLELVVAGYNWGTIFALDGKTGAVKWTHDDPTGRCFAYANGALLTDMDGNGTREVVVALASNDEVDAVFVLDGATGKRRGQLALPGAILSYMTPVATDVDGNGKREVFLQGGDGRLRELTLKATGLSVSRTVDLGAESWVAPAFVDLNQDGAFEIAAASVKELRFFDGKTMALRDRYISALGGLMPTTVAGDLDRNGTLDLLLGSWSGETLERIEFSIQSAATWRRLAGGAQRSGEQAPAAALPSNSALDAARDKVQALINGGTLSPSVAQTMKNRILPQLDSAEQRVLRGEIAEALERIETAISRLEREVTGYDSTALRRELAELAIATAQMYRERVAAFAGAPALSSADQDLKRARDYLAVNNFFAAADAAERAAERVSTASDRVGT